MSAHRRSQKRGGTTVEQPVLDVSNIARRLWIGAAPPFDRHIPEFDVLVLCAAELQPMAVGFQGSIIRCPIPDSVLSQRETNRALVTGRTVAGCLLSGRRVLVTCAAGRNRSALIAGLALGLATRMTPSAIVALIRMRRSSECLSNPYFVEVMTTYLKRLPTSGAPSR